MYCKVKLNNDYASRLVLEKDRFILFFQIDRGKIAIRGKEMNKFCPQTDATTFAFASVFIPLTCPTPSPF